MLRQRALAAYKQSFKATKLAFGGDEQLLTAARQKIKESYLHPDESKSVEQRIKHMESVNKFLMRNIVQGRKTDAGSYHLNIHKETELGDNNSISETKRTLAAQGGGCCGGGSGLYK